MGMEINYALTVKEGMENTVSLCFEPHEEIGLEDGKEILLYLPKGTTVDQAQEVARYIRDHCPRIRVRRWNA